MSHTTPQTSARLHDGSALTRLTPKSPVKPRINPTPILRDTDGYSANFTIPSRSNPSAEPYNTTVTHQGAFHCDCPARSSCRCWHVEEAFKSLALFTPCVVCGQPGAEFEEVDEAGNLTHGFVCACCALGFREAVEAERARIAALRPHERPELLTSWRRDVWEEIECERLQAQAGTAPERYENATDEIAPPLLWDRYLGCAAFPGGVQ